MPLTLKEIGLQNITGIEHFSESGGLPDHFLSETPKEEPIKHIEIQILIFVFGVRAMLKKLILL